MSTLETAKDPILIDVPMPIETPRLILRPIGPGDGAEAAAAIAETQEDLYRWMPWAENPADNTAEKQEIRSRKVHAQFILREDIPIVGIEKSTGRMVVWTGLHEPDWQYRKFFIGYWVRKSAQGQGYAAESTNALLRYAFNVLQAKRIVITHAEGNEASRKTIEKLGFAREGVHLKAGMLPGNRVVDGYSYARLDADGLPPLEVKWGPP